MRATSWKYEGKVRFERHRGIESTDLATIIKQRMREGMKVEESKVVRYFCLFCFIFSGPSP